MTLNRRRSLRAVAIVLLIAVVLPLAACGKRAPPDPPPGSEKNAFPKVYPNPNEQ